MIETVDAGLVALINDAPMLPAVRHEIDVLTDALSHLSYEERN